MGTTLCLLRHGRSSGQGPDAPLMPEGAEHIARLGRRLAREGFVPARAYASPFRRASETARVLLAEVAPALAAESLHELTPEHDPGDLAATLAGLDLPAARVLLVAHLPLLGLLVQRLAHDVVNFSPGTLVELKMDADWREGRVVRILGPEAATG